MAFEDDGVNPELVERWMLYCAIGGDPAGIDHDRLTLPTFAAAVRFTGAGGGAACSPTNGATEGTPAVETMKSRYCPGGAVVAAEGAVTVRPPAAGTNCSGT